MEYLHLFETQVSHDSLYEGDNYKEPWIAYTLDNASVTFNKPHDYSKDYFTIEALEDGNVTITIPDIIDSTYVTYISYSKDKSTWVKTDVNNTKQIITIPVSRGENVYLKGIAKAWCNADKEYGAYINSTANINASGNVMSLLYGDNYKNKIAFSDESKFVFASLFSGNMYLINAENLVLPATTLSESCYEFMFQGCTSLTTAPELPATALANNCYFFMFSGCTALTTAPELPATTLADWCYSDMFNGCTALTTAPKLPATKLATNCYYGMFRGCTALTTSPKLPATTLAYECYSSMFEGCKSLTVAPALQDTILADSCYSDMFLGCTSLITAPELPATTLTNSCYSGMFSGCTSLITAPKLPATTLTPSCYKQMFQNCSMLNSITMLATNVSASNCLNDWVSNVAATGTFIKAPSMTSLPIDSSSGIPTGWTVIDDTEYLTLTALGNGTITITIPAQVDSTYATSLSYSKNKSKWTETIIDDTEQTISIPVSSGENVYLKGIAKAWYNDDEGYGININSTANINASGNIMSLLYGDDFKVKMSLPEEREFIFCELFIGNKCLVNAENLILPATTLTNSCYSGMFSGCTSLITAPALQATILAYSCYSGMFYDCTSLTTAPELPATTLASYCYAHMFYGCTSLTTAPELPATTLADWCYLYMFSGCTSLITAPELPVTTLTPYCYREMFNGCTSLTTAPALPAMTLATNCYYEMFRGCTALTVAPALQATILADSCYYGMFYECSSLTTAPELHATTLKNYCYDRMFYECSSLTTAPELPAPALINGCYYQMFYNCSKLNSIAMFATDISASNCLYNWVSGVAATGTFVKAPSMTSLTTGVNGIPKGWAVMDDSEYLTLTALDNGNITITIPADIDSSYVTSLSYSKDKATWNETIIDDTAQTISIPVSSDENVYLKGIAKQLGNNKEGVNINSTTNINASGNVMSLLYGDNYKNKIAFPNGSQYTLGFLFKNNTHLINAENLILPATTLANGCYAAMFQGCKSLTAAPELPATTLSKTCYFYMFYNCSNLNKITMLATDISATSCLKNWVKNVASTGTFTKASSASLPSGFDGIPSGWTIKDK